MPDVYSLQEKLQIFWQRQIPPSMEKAFIAMLPEAQLKDYKPVVIIPRKIEDVSEIAIEADKSNHAVWRFYGCRSCEFQDRTRRDLWIPWF